MKGTKNNLLNTKVTEFMHSSRGITVYIIEGLFQQQKKSPESALP